MVDRIVRFQEREYPTLKEAASHVARASRRPVQNGGDVVRFLGSYLRQSDRESEIHLAQALKNLVQNGSGQARDTALDLLFRHGLKPFEPARRSLKAQQHFDEAMITALAQGEKGRQNREALERLIRSDPELKMRAASLLFVAASRSELTGISKDLQKLLVEVAHMRVSQPDESHRTVPAMARNQVHTITTPAVRAHLIDCLKHAQKRANDVAEKADVKQALRQYTQPLNAPRPSVESATVRMRPEPGPKRR